MANNKGNRNPFETRCGKLPDTRKLPFSFTTADVEEYLQKKVNGVVNGLRNKGKLDCDIDIHVCTIKFGRDFYPFMLILPEEVLDDDGHKRGNHSDELAIMNPHNYDGSHPMKSAFTDLFRVFAFNNDDRAMFSQNRWLQEVGVDRTRVPKLISYTKPKTSKSGRGKSTVRTVMLLIDPLRVFHDMVTNPSYPNEDFIIGIEKNGITKMKDGIFRYDFKKVPSNSKKGKKRKNQQDIEDQLHRAGFSS